MKISVAQLDIKAGHPDINVSKILTEIENAKNNSVDIIIFSELCVSGYLLGDEWENLAFMKDCFSYNETIKNATDGIIVIWGNVDLDFTSKNEDGRIRKYNAAFIAQNGRYIGTSGNLKIGRVYKTLMPKYREFDDERHFYSYRKCAQDFNLDIERIISPFRVEINNEYKKIGIILCEDMWSDDYTINPIDILLKHNPDVIVNLSCSPWTWRKNNKRHSVVRERIKNKPTYFAYCNNTGTQNNGKNIFLFDGGSTIYNPDGTFLNVAKNYTEEIITSTLFDNRIMLPNLEITPDQDKKELFEGLVYGIKKFFDTLPSKKVVIGLSGGIDSALDIVLLSEAIGAENVYAINMPSKFNSNTTKDAALQLAINLGVHYGVLSIQNAVDNTIKDIEQLTFYNYVNSDTTGLSLSKLNIENIQARDRGSRVLAGVASALDAVFINNGNKTETAFGYATLYGDVNGSISPIADLYKHEIYELCEYYNKLKKSEIIPSTIFNIVASAELSDEQNVDEGKGDPIFYPYHDKLVRAFVEFRLDPEDILRLYAEKKLVETILCEQSLIDNYFTDETFIADLEQKWKAYKISIFKRIQAPPIIAVSRRAFGFDLREAQNGVYFTREYTNLKNSILKIKI